VTIDRTLERGSVDFLGTPLLVAKGALVPREETELLARTAIERVRSIESEEIRVIDLCCGVGNLACAIALEIPNARVFATDLTYACADVARRNVERHSLSSQVSVHQGDLFDALDGLGLEGTIEVIVCNPPYISDSRLLGESAHLLEHEPREAFAAGPYGIAVHQRVVKDAPRFLRPGGTLLFEIGLGQHRQVEMLFTRAKVYDPAVGVANVAGDIRVVCATLAAVAELSR